MEVDPSKLAALSADMAEVKASLSLIKLLLQVGIPVAGAFIGGTMLWVGSQLMTLSRSIGSLEGCVRSLEKR